MNMPRSGKFLAVFRISYLLAASLGGCTNSPTAASEEVISSSSGSLTFMRKETTYSFFTLANSSGQIIEFDGSIGDDGVIYPRPYVGTVECKIDTIPVRWVAYSIAMGSWTKPSSIKLEPGRSIVIAFDTTDASGKTACRIAFSPRIGTKIVSNTF